MSDTPYTYWASERSDIRATRALEKVRAFRRWFYNTGYAAKALKGWRYANGWTDNGESSSRLQMGGERQQLVKAVINGVRPLRQRTVAMVLSGNREMKPIASNSDAAARQQADLGRGVLEHIHRVHKRSARDRKVLALAIDMSEAGLVIEWDARAGKVVAVKPVEGDDGTPVAGDDGMPLTEPAAWEGDFRYWVASTFDIYRDVGIRDWEDASWIIVRRWVSRYRQAAIYPEKADEILRVSTVPTGEDEFDYFQARLVLDFTNETDVIPEYVLWHKDTPELPGGCEMRFLSDGTVLSDGPYPYDGMGLPCIRLVPEDVSCTSLGYTNMFDALGLSDAVNAIASGAITNVTTGAVPPLLNPKGSGLSKGVPIGSGHIVLDISRKDEAPFFMEPPQTPQEAYKLLEVLERWRLEGFGLNETSMGRPPYSGMAAQAMALLDAKADEYQDSLRTGYDTYLAEAATFELRILKRYAKEERIAQIVGKSKQWMAKAFTAESLSLIEGFHVEPVGTAARTMAGKFGMLETFANFNVPLAPEQIVELTETGQYESDFEAPLAQRYGLKEEKEALQTGDAPHTPLITDKHWIHIPEHLALLDSPEARQQPELVERVMTAVSAHLELWRSMPMDLLALMGGPPPPPPGPPAGMMGMAPPVPAGSGNPPQGEPAPSGAAQGAVNALDPNAEAPELPQAPMAG